VFVILALFYRRVLAYSGMLSLSLSPRQRLRHAPSCAPAPAARVPQSRPTVARGASPCPAPGSVARSGQHCRRACQRHLLRSATGAKHSSWVHSPLHALCCTAPPASRCASNWSVERHLTNSTCKGSRKLAPALPAYSPSSPCRWAHWQGQQWSPAALASTHPVAWPATSPTSSAAFCQ